MWGRGERGLWDPGQGTSLLSSVFREQPGQAQHPWLTHIVGSLYADGESGHQRLVCSLSQKAPGQRDEYTAKFLAQTCSLVNLCNLPKRSPTEELQQCPVYKAGWGACLKDPPKCRSSSVVECWPDTLGSIPALHKLGMVAMPVIPALRWRLEDSASSVLCCIGSLRPA